MIEIEKTPGTKIPYASTKTSVIFGDEDLLINLRNRELDDTALIDVCADSNGFLVIGAAVGLRYIAQVEIPARRYIEEPIEQAPEVLETSEEEEGGESRGPSVIRKAVPFDIKLCKIYLWGMED